MSSDKPLPSDTLTLDEEALARVLVIYTGGTIAMCGDRHSAKQIMLPPSYLQSELKKNPTFHDFLESKGLTDDDPNSLILPCTAHDNMKRVLYRILEFSPLIESANTSFKDYTKIANCIKENYSSYDGFVILHGTDTMAYTASALSFMLEGLRKPVILTGSQVPIFETRSDGRLNLINSLQLAGNVALPEVMICFNNVLLRGNRCSKVDSFRFSAFESPNYSPLAELHVSIKVNKRLIFRQDQNCLSIQSLCEDVGMIKLYPSITPKTLRDMLDDPMQGCVLQSYGVGNAPDTQLELLAEIKKACERGVLIVNITQCYAGQTAVHSSCAQKLADAGVISGGDMTPEAAMMKIAYIVSKPDLDIQEKIRLLRTNLRGEISVQSDDPLSQILDCVQYLDKRIIRSRMLDSFIVGATEDGEIAAVKNLLHLKSLYKEKGDITDITIDNQTLQSIARTRGHRNLLEWLMEQDKTGTF